jgi:hypothetical protein
MESPLLGVARSAGRFEGWYAPSRPGRWTLRIALPDRMAGAVTAVEVNGTRSAAKRLADGRFVVMGSSAEGKPLRWALR